MKKSPPDNLSESKLPNEKFSDECKSIEEKSSSHSAKTICLLLAISLARIGSGLFISIHGPTLITLANNVGSTVGQVSWLFSGRSLGVLLGGMVTGPVMRRFDNLLGFGITCLILGGVIIATPWIEALWLLVIVVLFGGLCFGYLDAAMQALILQLWGEKESRGFISGYHFMIALGAFLAPIIAQPFLNQSAEDTCSQSNNPVSSTTNFPLSQTQDSIATSTNQTYFSYTTAANQSDEINPVVWAYLICGVFLVTVAIFFAFLSCLKLESSVRKARGSVIEDRAEESVKSLILLFVLISIYYFFCVAGETSYNSYIYSISICSDLQFTTSMGSIINSLFWAGFGLGRLGGVIFLRYISPRNVILIDLAGTIISMIIVSILGNTVAEVTWAVTFIYGFFQATIYPAGVSWVSTYTNMSGNYIFVFSIGQALGTMTLVPVGGILFDIEPFYVMFMVLGCSVCNAVIFLLMIWEGKRLKRASEADLGLNSMSSQL